MESFLCRISMQKTIRGAQLSSAVPTMNAFAAELAWFALSLGRSSSQ
jgi:hypothetical protein